MYEQDEKFNEFWSENYKAHFGDCEPYKGIAEYAYEQGWNEGRRKLEEENRRLAALVENIRNCGNCKTVSRNPLRTSLEMKTASLVAVATIMTSGRCVYALQGNTATEEDA